MLKFNLGLAVLPALAEDAEAFLNCPGLAWRDLETPMVGTRIERFKPLMTRIDRAQIDAMLGAARENATA